MCFYFSDLRMEFGVSYCIWDYDSGCALTFLLASREKLIYSMTGYQGYIDNVAMYFLWCAKIEKTVYMSYSQNQNQQTHVNQT